MKKIVSILTLSMLAVFMLAGCNGGTGAENAAANTGSELTIATPFTDGFIESAARRFEELHDNRYTVNIVVYEPQAFSQTITTALMGGGGEDIISSSWLAWERIADAGMLVDLNGVMSFPAGEYYQNVPDALLHNDGGRYVLPLSFSISAFSFTDAVPENSRPDVLMLENLLALAEASAEIPMFATASGLGSSPVSIAAMYFDLYFDDFINLSTRQVNVENEKFIAMIENVNAISDRLTVTGFGEATLLQEEMLFSPAMSNSGTVDYSDMLLAANSSGESLVNVQSLMAINANSGNQELAARFLQFLISEDMQTSPELFLNPINKNAAAANAATMLETVRAYGQYDGSTAGFDLENNIAIFNGLTERLALSGTSDPNIGSFVWAEMQRFFDGEVTAGQAASNLQARLTTYLNE
jgi:multiple sugar transport system substrate-binding protein